MTEKAYNRRLLLFGAILLAFYICIEQAYSLPLVPNDGNSWPTFQKRNIAALARDGYIKSAQPGYKRSISTLAKNGQLPTFRSPYDETDKQEDESDGTEKRNIQSIARLRSFAASKRNIQALARDGYRGGRSGQYTQNDKRNIQALARDGFIHKRDDDDVGDEFYFPFYQNSIPPLSEIDGPIDYNELYDLQQSMHPDLLPPLTQIYKRDYFLNDRPDYYNQGYDYNTDYSNKRGAFGSPVHGVFRSTFVEPNSRVKRYVLSLPDVIDHNDLPAPDNDNVENQDKRSVDVSDLRDNFEKRHIGSLARLGLLPSFRYSGSRYSRSGRTMYFVPSQEVFRKHPDDSNLGVRQYISSSEIEPATYPDDPDVPQEALSPNSHPTGRILHRPLSNDLPPPPLLHAPILSYADKYSNLLNNKWKLRPKELPKFYHFRSHKIPMREPGKRYLLHPAIDNVMLRKHYPNSSLPSRRKNQ